MRLLDTTLTAIVRDEVMNPAGGIVRFLGATVPFVEEAVIVDTGSVDGTRELLEEAQSQYPHLRVLDHPFDGYAQSRNFSLDAVTTKRVVVLDADELIVKADWSKLGELLESRPQIADWHLDFREVFPHGEQRGFGHNVRIFNVTRKSGGKIFRRQYENTVWEGLYDDGCCLYGSPRTGVPIYHFKPSECNDEVKRMNWYRPLGCDLSFASVAPSTVYGFADWKQLNPLRDNYN